MTPPSSFRLLRMPPPWVRRLLIAVAVVMIALQWINTRIAILRMNQNPSQPVVLATYPIYHSMATGMREGRIGQVDLLAVRDYALLNNVSAPFERRPREAEHQWVNYYTLDVGYSFIVEAARLAFPTLPDNHLRALAMQLAFDVVVVAFVGFLFAQWNLALGLLASYLYASDGIFYDLVSFAFYYYWDIPLTLIVLGAMLLAYRRDAEATAWLSLGAAALGFGVWLRGSWWPLALFLCGVAVLHARLRRHLLVPLLVFAVIATPAVVRASRARGTLTFTTRAVWHVALVGLGYYPNPYGLKATDGSVFELTRQKYGIEFRSEDYWVHDQAAKKEFLAIWQNDRSFVIRSFFGRLKESIAGTTQTSVLSFIFMTNLTYRLICLAGCVAMIARGGDRRLLAIAAAGMFALYVVLTCVFYFVGLAYDNVSEVTRFICFIGAIDAAMFLAVESWRRLAARAAAGAALEKAVPSRA
ncbi:MAG TPA: hypothetical protein VKE51_40270 [Vicinamibacterales bacterium]|nr:hypothetical protein [Vicinamibacterales bacterium]